MSTKRKRLYETPSSETVEVRMKHAILQDSVRSNSAEGMLWEND